MSGFYCLALPDFYFETTKELHNDHLFSQFPGTAGSLKSYLYVILNISSKVMSLMESFIPNDAMPLVI